METEHDESKGALNEDNPTPPEDAGQKGAGVQTGGQGGLDEGTEPEGEDARDSERP